MYSALLKSTRTDQCAGDSKKLFNLVKFLCNDPNMSALPTLTELFVKKKIDLVKDSGNDI